MEKNIFLIITKISYIKILKNIVLFDVKLYFFGVFFIKMQNGELSYKIKNRFKDENSKPILNLFIYFKSSILTNLSTLKTRRDPHLFDEWLD